MTTLAADVSATQTLLPVTGVAPVGSQGTSAYHGFYTLGSESIRVVGLAPDTSWLVYRGVAGTTAAAHSSGATLTRYDPDAPSGEGEGVVMDHIEPTTATPEAIVDALIASGRMAAS